MECRLANNEMIQMTDNIVAIPELEKLKRLWYNTDSIAFEIINAIKYRETAFIPVNKQTNIANRYLKINAVRYLSKNFFRFGFFETNKLYNLYNTISVLPNMPMFSFKPEEKKLEQKEFSENFEKYITKYDLFFDIDMEEGEDFNLVYSSTYRLKKLLDDYKIKYSLFFSGNKGFHLKVYYDDFPEQFKKISFDKLAYLFKTFAFTLKRFYKIPNLDLKIFDLKRLSKTAYSVVYPYYYVALPLTDEQFDNFSFNEVFLPNLIDKTDSMRQRGLLIRAGEPENLLSLMIDISKLDNKKRDYSTLYDVMREYNLL